MLLDDEQCPNPLFVFVFLMEGKERGGNVVPLFNDEKKTLIFCVFGGGGTGGSLP